MANRHQHVTEQTKLWLTIRSNAPYEIYSLHLPLPPSPPLQTTPGNVFIQPTHGSPNPAYTRRTARQTSLVPPWAQVREPEWDCTTIEGGFDVAVCMKATVQYSYLLRGYTRSESSSRLQLVHPSCSPSIESSLLIIASQCSSPIICGNWTQTSAAKLENPPILA